MQPGRARHSAGASASSGPTARFATAMDGVADRTSYPHVEVDVDSGLDEVSYVQCELLRSINRRRLVTQLGAVDLHGSVHGGRGVEVPGLVAEPVRDPDRRVDRRGFR